MQPTRTPPPFVPTLTEVVRLPERSQAAALDPEVLVAQVLQRLAPQLEALVRQAVHDTVAALPNASPPSQRLPD